MPFDCTFFAVDQMLGNVGLKMYDSRAGQHPARPVWQSSSSSRNSSGSGLSEEMVYLKELKHF